MLGRYLVVIIGLLIIGLLIGLQIIGYLVDILGSNFYGTWYLPSDRKFCRSGFATLGTSR